MKLFGTIIVYQGSDHLLLDEKSAWFQERKPKLFNKLSKSKEWSTITINRNKHTFFVCKLAQEVKPNIERDINNEIDVAIEINEQDLSIQRISKLGLQYISVI